MSAIQKYSEVVKNLEFCDDFGDGPLLMGHFTTDRSLIAVVSLLGGFVAVAGLGIPGALFVAFAALNDCRYAGKVEADEDEKSPAPGVTAVDGAIDVPSETVGETNAIAAAPSMSMVNGVESIAPRDIATDLGNNPQSALIFGTPGAGKGMTISNAIRTLRAKLPAVTVMMVDPKGDKKERGYWESQVDIFESRALLKTSPRSSAEWMMRCIEKFQDIDGPKLLVWDELFASITVLKGQNIPKGEDAFPCLTDFQQFISLNLSLGPSSGTWVWGMSQSANLSDLGLTSGGLSTTRIIALISPDNVGAVEGYLATKAITATKGGMEALDRLMEQSPVGRACYDGKTKRWYPTAKLENHSGFDRDSADWNNLGKVAQTSAPEKPTRALEEVFPPEFFQGHPLLEEDAIEVETQAIDDKPDGLDDFPLVLTIWEYLIGKDARSMKQISGAMKTGGKISDDVLTSKLGQFETYKDAIKTVVSFGVSKGYLRQVSDDAYESVRKH